MRRTLFRTISLLAIAALVALAISGCKGKSKADKLSFGGGPTGGTFGHFANAISLMLSKQMKKDVSSEGTGGSAANLKMINSGSLSFGIVYSGDAYLGRQGKLAKDANKYTDVQAVSFLYGAPAQLVALKSSKINSPMDLVGKKVAVGNAGSGAALSAERYFKALKIWDKIKPQFLGYSAAASALKDGHVAAFWVIVGYPNSSIIEVATVENIVILDLVDAGEKGGFFKEFLFYAKTELPANTYKGQTKAVKTFMDVALWAASSKVSEQVVYDALKIVYSEAGLKTMVTAHTAAKAMSLKSGIDGIATPMHPGAKKFWKEQNLTITKDME